MDTKKKNNNKNNKHRNKDVAGIICIIISSFFLICLITPLLSDIGEFVKRLTMGLLGYISYPVLLCTLFGGILMLMDKKPSVTGKQIAYIILMAICAVFILQTALDAAAMGGDLGSYLTKLISFDPENVTAGNSAGGVIFGLFAYLIKAVLTFVGAYVLYSLLLILFGVLLILDFRKTVAERRKEQKKLERQPIPPFEKGHAVGQDVRDINDTSLPVYTIEPNHRIASHSGEFSFINEPTPDTLPRYDSAPQQPEETLDEKKANAMKILYGDVDEMFKSYDSTIKGEMHINEYSGGRSNSFISDDAFGPSHAVTPPFVKREPQPEVVKPTLPEVPIPPEKDISGDLVDGPILNGDEVSKSIQDSKRLRYAEDKPPVVPPIVTGDPQIDSSAYKSTYMSDIADTGRSVYDTDDDGLPPIITGRGNVRDEEKTISAPSRERDERESEEHIEPSLPPILNGDEFRDRQNANTAARTETPDLNEQPNEEQPPIISGVYEFDEEKPFEEDRAAAVNNEESKEPYEDLPEIIDADNSASEEPIEFNVAESDEFVGNAYDDVPIINADEFDPNAVIREEKPEDRPADELNFIERESEETPSEVAQEREAESDQADETEETPSEVAEFDLPEIDISDIDENADETEDSTENEKERAQSEGESEPNKFEAKIPDTLKLADEEVDMSESTGEIDNDNTGYYTTENFDKHVDEISLKLNDSGISGDNKANTQINMDDYRVEVPAKKPVKKKHLRYTPPPIDLLTENTAQLEDNEDYESIAKNIEEVLRSFKLDADVVNITKGPAVTRYELQMPLGQSVKRISNYADDIAYALALDTQVRIEAPVRGKRAVGVEVPNSKISMVRLREIIDSKKFTESKSYLTLALGKDIAGNIITCNLENMPHLLIAGTTGSGKSACLNAIIISMLYKSSPDDVRLILVDPKQVEFVLYRGMPHLLIKNPINDCAQAINAFKWARDEMERRYTMFAQYAARNLADFNECSAVKTGLEVKLPRIVIIVDELAELMLAPNAKELEDNIKSMAQKGRAAGMHLVIATQRPSVDVITGTIKANFPSRIAFKVKSLTDSRTILDQMGAETLLGNGDMLYAPTDWPDPKRIQGAFISTEEVTNVVDFIRQNNETDFDQAVEDIILKAQEEKVSSQDEEKSGDAAMDPLMKDVLRKVIETGQASASFIQRRFSVGYARAARIIDQMEEKGFIGPMDGVKPREVFITREKFAELYGEAV